MTFSACCAELLRRSEKVVSLEIEFGHLSSKWRLCGGDSNVTTV